MLLSWYLAALHRILQLTKVTWGIHSIRMSLKTSHHRRVRVLLLTVGRLLNMVVLVLLSRSSLRPSRARAYIFNNARTRKRPVSKLLSLYQHHDSGIAYERKLSLLATPSLDSSNTTSSPPLRRLVGYEACNEISQMENWRDHPDLNPTIDFPSWAVPGKSIQTVLTNPLLQPYLARSLDLLENLHVHIPNVRDRPHDNDYAGDLESKSQRQKIILLHPDTPSIAELPERLQQLLRDNQIHEQGPTVSIPFNFKQFTASYILSKILPADARCPPTPACL